MKNLLLNWNLMRALRLILGVIIVVQGIQSHEWVYASAGLLLSGMAIANIGCCGVGGCAVPQRRSTVTKESLKDLNEIEYEELGTSK